MAGEEQTIGRLGVELFADGREYMSTLTELTSQSEDMLKLIVTGFEGASAAIITSVAAISAASIKEYATFQASFINSTANMRGATDEMKAKMQDMAVTISNESTSTANEVAKAFGILKNNGMDAAQALEAIGVADDFATASGQKLILATNELAKATVAVGMASKDAVVNAANMAHVADLITVASREGNGTMKDFAVALTEAGTQIKMLSGGVKEGAAFLTAWTETGKSAESGANALHMVLRSLQAGMVSHSQAWAQYGMTIYDTTGKLKPLTEIIDLLHYKMGDLDDADQRLMESQLGLSTRTLEIVKNMEGLGDGMESARQAMEKAGGATKKLADEQMASLDAQSKVLWNSLNNLLLVLGSQLTPVVTGLSQTIKDMTSNAKDNDSAMNELGSTLKTVFVTTLGGVLDVMHAFNFALLSGQMLILAIARTATYLYELRYGFTAAKLAAEEFDDAMHKVALQMKASMDAPLLSETLTKNVTKATEAIHALGTSTADSAFSFKISNQAIAGFNDTMRDMGEKVVPEIYAALNMLGYSWNKNEEAMKKVEIAYREGGITSTEYMQLLTKLNTTIASAPINKQLSELAMLQAGYNAGKISAEELALAVQKLNNTYEVKTGIKGVDDMQQIQKDLKTENDLYAANKKAIVDWETAKQQDLLQAQRDGDTKKIAQIQSAILQQNALTDQMTAAHNAKITQDNQKMYAAELNAAQSTADSLANIAQDLFGKQNAAYKALFDISKAFSIVQATMNMYTAIGQAMALPWPANLAAAASAAAYMATIVGDIEAMSFDGGGYTGDNVRAGGIDGIGGFMAVLHPQEMVTDMSKGQMPPGTGQGTSTGPATVNIHNYAGSDVQAQSSPDGKVLNIMIKAVKQAMSQDIRQGGGAISLALEQSYNMRRGQPTP